MMTTANSAPVTTMEKTASGTALAEPDLRHTARIAGLFYLGLLITGVLGNLVVRQQLYAVDDAQATLSNVLDQPTMARLEVALELGIVLTQALAAMWFYRLFRRIDSFMAASLAIFGMVNATLILISAAALATAHDVATDSALKVANQAGAVQTLYLASGHLWGVCAVFFGLWLIPMGWLAFRSGWFPPMLGWTLVVGGVCYTLSAFLGYLVADADVAVSVLTIPATIGEVWILGYLIIYGISAKPAVAPVEAGE